MKAVFKFFYIVCALLLCGLIVSACTLSLGGNSSRRSSGGGSVHSSNNSSMIDSSVSSENPGDQDPLFSPYDNHVVQEYDLNLQAPYDFSWEARSRHRIYIEHEDFANYRSSYDPDSYDGMYPSYEPIIFHDYNTLCSFLEEHGSSLFYYFEYDYNGEYYYDVRFLNADCFHSGNGHMVTEFLPAEKFYPVFFSEVDRLGCFYSMKLVSWDMPFELFY